jgi:competence protein ComEA
MRLHGLTKCASVVAVALGVVVGMSSVAPGQAAKAKAKAKAAPKALLDLNSATAEQLAADLPGVGPVTAKKIVAGRPYTTVDDLAKAGVPARTINEIRPLVTVGAAPKLKVVGAKPAAAKPAVAIPAAAIDLNKATAAELETLPGIGPVHALAIIGARPFSSVDDLAKVKGLGPARINALRGLVTASAAPVTATSKTVAAPAGRMTKKAAAAPKAVPAKPVNINTASKAELDVLPGIGPVKAQAIIDARPFKTIEDIMKVKGIKEGEFSKIKDLITVK